MVRGETGRHDVCNEVRRQGCSVTRRALKYEARKGAGGLYLFRCGSGVFGNTTCREKYEALLALAPRKKFASVAN